MATRDSLTSLWDRKTFNEDMGAFVNDALISVLPLALIIVDIDHFKQVNDTHGHLFGDKVLVGVARCLLPVVKGKGRVYRLGGDEMTIILPNHGLGEATAVAERVRITIEQEQINGIEVTVSLGVSVLPDHGSEPLKLLSAADQAAYEGKRLGPNLVRFFGEPDPPEPGTREPRRKTPEPGPLTEKQKEKLRKEYFQGIKILCPRLKSIVPGNSCEP